MEFMTLLLWYLYLVGGGYTNNKTRDIVNRYLMYASPSRYSIETYFRLLADNSGYESYACDFYGFNLGYGICLSCMWSISILILLLGWVVIVRKNRQLP